MAQLIYPTRSEMPEIVGPYSEWPQKRKTQKKRIVWGSLGVASVAGFVHCILPMLA